jgi:hypothetical protein
VQQIAEELGVRYILEGSVQRSGDRVRITAQLIDATGGYHLWADSFDRKIDDIFSLQDEIAMKIMAELQVKLTVDELGRISAIKTKTSRLTRSIYWVMSILSEERKPTHSRREMLLRKPFLWTRNTVHPTFF